VACWCERVYGPDALPITQRTVSVRRMDGEQLKGSVKEPNKFHNYETEKSLVKQVVQQNISSCLVLPPEIVMHNAFNIVSIRPPIYVSSCMTISGGRTEQLDIIAGFLLHHWLYEWFFVHRKRLPIYASCMTISGGRTEQHVIIGFGELAAVD